MASLIPASASCLASAVDLLKRHVPEELYIYERTRSRHDFAIWLQPDRHDLGVATGIHETLHMLDADLSGFDGAAYSIDAGRTLCFPRFSTFYRSEVSRLLPPDQRDSYHDSYLSGSCGQQGFDLLLEELNAYTHGCRTAARLAHRMPSGAQVSERDGLASFMLYLLMYLKCAFERHRDVWNTLAGDGACGTLVSTLWSRAVAVLQEAMRHPQLGIWDARKRGLINEAENIGWLRRYLHAARQPAPSLAPAGGQDVGGLPMGGPLRRPEQPLAPVSRRTRTDAIEGPTSIRIIFDGKEISTAEELERLLREQPALRKLPHVEEALKLLRRA